MRFTKTKNTILLWALLTWGCSASPPIHTIDSLDLNRFMGKWYVIANIPTIFEKNAYNAVEFYRLDEDGSVETTFRFNKGSFDGPEKVYQSRAFVLDDQSNAHWGMQFVWPFKAEYRVVYLSDDYSQTVIGRTKRDYVWIMARESSLSDADYERLLMLLESFGYDTSRVQKVPQQAPGDASAG